MTTAADIWCPPLPPLSPGGIARPRIGIGGISIESSTFSPHLSGDEAFRIREGDELIDYYPFLRPGTELRQAADWVPLSHGRSLPGGAVVPATYERMRDRLVCLAAEAGPLDGFLLDIHGAMSVVDRLDAEADLAARLRAALGPDTLVSATMDLHGNVSAELLAQLDLITCYRMAPHEDAMNTKERAAWHLLARLRGPLGRDPQARRPHKAWVQVPLLLPGEKTSTRVEPARSIYDFVAEVADRDEIMDAALWVGYAWADEPRCQAAVVVTGDDAAAAATGCREIAERYWAAGALDQALRPAARRPFFISDSGDNPTAGGAGDAAWTLGQLAADRRLRSEEYTVLYASVFDPVAVATAKQAGIGATITVTVGGRVDDRTSPPAELTAVVANIVDGDPVAGTQVVLRQGSLHCIVTTSRKPFHRLQDFRDLGLEPTTADVVIVKIGYLEPELHQIAADWVLALTPGGVDQDLLRLGHHNLAPGVWPFDTSNDSPDLAPIISRGR
ncbi:MAG: microcystin degradation protein MlrC [Arachnia propionica]|nr:MAG: microcystin degradation protein MlrC [Arachnia propionica]